MTKSKVNLWDSYAGKGFAAQHAEYAERAAADINGNDIVSTYSAKIELDTKVDKVEGKGLSENDYTDADKAKVATLDSWKAGRYTVPYELEIDGRKYAYVQIGTKLWMAENLAVTSVGTLGTDYFYPNDDSSNADRGYLYKLSSLVTVEQFGYEYRLEPKPAFAAILPSGWRLPTYDEFAALLTPYSSNVAAVKSSQYWQTAGNNSTGLNIVPTGLRNWNGTYFDKLNTEAPFWTSTYHLYQNTWGKSIAVSNTDIVTIEGYLYGNQNYALAIRLVKDLE